MVTKEALQEMKAANEKELAELSQKIQVHQQQAALCERNMIHLAGKIDMLNKMLAATDAEVEAPAAPASGDG